MKCRGDWERRPVAVLTACGKSHAAFERRCIPPEPRLFEALCVAFRSKYTRYSSLTRLVSRAPRRSRCSRHFLHRLLNAASARRRGRLGAPVSDRHRPPPAGERVIAARTDGATPGSSAIWPGGRYAVAALRAACRSEAPTGRTDRRSKPADHQVACDPALSNNFMPDGVRRGRRAWAFRGRWPRCPLGGRRSVAPSPAPQAYHGVAFESREGIP